MAGAMPQAPTTPRLRSALIPSAIVRCDDPLPPPRPGVRYVKLGRWRTVVADDDLRSRIDRRFHWPMIVLALLVLPLLAVELFYLDRLAERERSWVGLLCWIGFSMVWLAFLIEFLIKIAVAECRLEYVRRNWLDIIIIIVPVLRPLRLTSLTRTSRVFKLRGVGMKVFRYGLALVVGLEAAQPYLQRMGLRRLKGRKDPEEMTRHELMAEVRRLRRESDAWERWHAAEQRFLADDGRRMTREPSREQPQRADSSQEPSA